MSPVPNSAHIRRAQLKESTSIGRSAKAVLTLSILMTAASGQTASFECERADTPVEKAVCADADLSLLDEELAAAYTQATSSSQAGNALQQDQRLWIKNRNACGPEIPCIKGQYAIRLAHLFRIQSAHTAFASIYQPGALKVLEARAGSRDHEAQFQLGVLYRYGHIVPFDARKAVALLEQAAQGRYAAAMLLLGSMYEFGQVVPLDLFEAEKWYARAAPRSKAANELLRELRDNISASYTYGLMGLPVDFEKALAYARLAGDEVKIQRLELSIETGQTNIMRSSVLSEGGCPGISRSELDYLVRSVDFDSQRAEEVARQCNTTGADALLAYGYYRGTLDTPRAKAAYQDLVGIYFFAPSGQASDAIVSVVSGAIQRDPQFEGVSVPCSMGYLWPKDAIMQMFPDDPVKAQRFPQLLGCASAFPVAFPDLRPLINTATKLAARPSCRGSIDRYFALSARISEGYALDFAQVLAQSEERVEAGELESKVQAVLSAAKKPRPDSAKLLKALTIQAKETRRSLVAFYKKYFLFTDTAAELAAEAALHHAVTVKLGTEDDC